MSLVSNDLTGVLAEVWRNGKLVTDCELQKDFEGSLRVVAKYHLSDGEYMIRTGSTLYLATFKDGKWSGLRRAPE